jgi:outer membrane beta-barrel protein
LTRTLAAVACLLVFTAARDAGAQSTPGQPPSATPPAPSTPAPAAPGTQPVPTTEGLGLDLTEEPGAKAAPVVALPTDKKLSDAPVLDEKSLTEDDRVKSIQRKVFLKTHRFELLPTIFIGVNDPYYTKWGGSVRGSYFLSDTLALAVHAAVYTLISTDDVRTAKADFQSRIFYSKPQWSVMGAVEWSPVYGKATIFNTIIHFDGFILAGLGAMWTETSSIPLDDKQPNGPKRGPYIAGELGVGLRFMTTDWLAVNLALIDTSYVEQPTGAVKGSIQNILALHAGISIFIPFRSTGRESE